MAWTDIPDDNLSPGAPARSADMIAMRDNFAALADGDAGAPKVQTEAIQDGSVTSNKLNSGLYSTGAVGTYALLVNVSFNQDISPGQVVAGSNLRYANVRGNSGGTPGGNWRCMGIASRLQFNEDSPEVRTTLWLRIS